MHWIDHDYPYIAYIVEVKYSGDISITVCRCKDLPRDKDNTRGFSAGFWDYESAARYARHIAAELQIPAIV